MWVWVYVGSCVSGRVIREGLLERETLRDGWGERGEGTVRTEALRPISGL